MAGATTLEAMKEVVLQLSAQHEADMAQQRAMTDIASRSSSEPRVDSYRERVPKLNKPDEFHGVRKELSSFLFQIDLRFKGDPMLFRTEASRVVYAISFLKGAAYRWVVPAQRAGLDTIYPTYALFEKAIRVAFGDPDEKGSALRAVAQLRQRGPCYEYSSEFQRLTAVLDWNVDALRDMYRNGLSNDVKDQLIHVEDTGTTLEDLIEKAQVIDRRIFERRVDRGKERTTSYAPRASTNVPGRNVTWRKKCDGSHHRQESLLRSRWILIILIRSPLLCPHRKRYFSRTGSALPARRPDISLEIVPYEAQKTSLGVHGGIDEHRRNRDSR